MKPGDVVMVEDHGLGVIAYEDARSFEDRWVVNMEDGSILSTFGNRLTVLPHIKSLVAVSNRLEDSG